MTKLSSRPTSSSWGLSPVRPTGDNPSSTTIEGDSPEASPVTPATRLRHKHLLGIADLSPEEIVLVLDTAEAMQEIDGTDEVTIEGEA